jgi:cell division septation protein DedD
MAELGTGQVKSRLLDDDYDQPRDTEITLGTGKLLSIFFGIAVVCAVFFTMGYLLGKSTAAGGRTEIVGAAATGGNANGKPSALNKAPEAPAPAASPDASAQQTNFSSPGNASLPASQASPAATTESSTGSSGTFMVQVAAVSKQEDADILVSALRKKQYPVFIANSAGDALFHVQVGPFTKQQDADTMKNRLSADGYNAIVKKPGS